MKVFKLNLVLLFLWLLLIPVFGQAGINTSDPQSTLDVSDGNTNVAPGIIAPRQSLQQLIAQTVNYTINQRAAIVYVTDASGNTNESTTNITKEGYYYYDGAQWQPFNDPMAGMINNWSITGNDNLSTTHGANYLGTNEPVDLVLKTTGTERMTVTSTGNVGIGTPTPSNKLHVKASANPLRLEGVAVSQTSSDPPLVVATDGTVKLGAFPIINIVPDDIGTVIAINKQLVVAQEVTVLMSADYTFSASSTLTRTIGNLTNEIIDNKNSFTGTSTGNSFKVEADGVYLIMINAQITTPYSSSPVVGIWNDTDGHWVARVNDTFTAKDRPAIVNLQTYSLTTAINMYANKTYSFRAANTETTTIRAMSSDRTGSGPVSFYSLKRLR